MLNSVSVCLMLLSKVRSRIRLCDVVNTFNVLYPLCRLDVNFSLEAEMLEPLAGLTWLLEELQS